MRITNLPDIFQHKLNDLFHVFEFNCAYIYDPLILTKGDCTYHVQKLELMINKLKEKDLNIILKGIFLDKLKWNI